LKSISRTKEDAEKLSGILQMAEAAKMISGAAGDIVKLLSVKLRHPLLPRLLKESDEMIRKMVVEEESPAVGRSLPELHVEGLEHLDKFLKGKIRVLE